MIRRYNTELRAWEVGYWVDNTRFYIVSIEKE